MFLLRLLYRSFTRQLRRRSLIALTVALCASICVAMLEIVLDMGDKLKEGICSGTKSPLFFPNPLRVASLKETISSLCFSLDRKSVV